VSPPRLRFVSNCIDLSAITVETHAGCGQAITWRDGEWGLRSRRPIRCGGKGNRFHSQWHVPNALL